jgi:hypothetical protein
MVENFINPPTQNGEIPNILIDYFIYCAKHKKENVTRDTRTKILTNQKFLKRFEIFIRTEILIKNTNNSLF